MRVHIVDALLAYSTRGGHTEWPLATWAIDDTGVSHSAHKHSHAGSHWCTEALDALLTRPVCNDLDCGSVPHFAPDAAAIVRQNNATPQTTVDSALAALEDAAHAEPRNTLRHLRLLHDRLNQPAYTDWAHATDVVPRTRHVIKSVQETLRTPTQAQHDLGVAARIILTAPGHNDFQTLKALIRAAENYNTPLLLHTLEHANACDGTDAWTSRMRELLYRIHDAESPTCAYEPTGARTNPTSGANPQPMRTWGELVEETLDRLPQWWNSSYQQLITNTTSSIIFLPPEHAHYNSELPWEAWRPIPTNNLLVAPYAVGPAAELILGVPYTTLPEAPTPSVLDTCHVLLNDLDGYVTTLTLDDLLETSRLLSR